MANMIALEQHEAVLFRMLSAFFGEDRVIPQMSIFAVCGGQLPISMPQEWLAEVQLSCARSPVVWAQQSRCLFTIVDANDEPKMVVEFVPDFSGTLDIEELNKRRFIRPALQAAGVNYVTISAQEYHEITLPGSSFTLSKLLQDKFDISEEIGP